MDGLRADFLILLLAGKAFAEYLTPIFTGISVPHLSPEQIKAFRFALPSVAEQERIVEWTASNTTKLGDAVLSANREISLLREYRIRLIADVVTGKLDVREAAVRLPVEVEEPEPLDDADTILVTEDEVPAVVEATIKETEA
jgi:type I restriction enzyme S subunit